MHSHWPFRLFVILALSALLTACSLPAAPTPGPTPLPSATPVPTRAIQPTFTPIPTTPASTPTLEATPTSSQRVTPTGRAATSVPLKGLLAYNLAQESMTGYDFTGAALQLQVKVPGAGGIGEKTAQWVNKTVYYLNPKEKAVYQVPASGSAQKLAFIPAKDSLSFLVSPDGKQITWSFMLATKPYPSCELWVANIDGSAAKKIVSLDPTANTKMLSLVPFRWLADGRLVFVAEPSGIGGTILFSGFASIQTFDLKSNRATDLTPALGAGGVCLEEISPDLNTLLSTCAGSDRSTLAYINRVNQQTLTITRQAEQNQVGSPVYSPSGGWLAYAFARGDPNNEQGRVAVLQNGATTPKILGTVLKGSFSVKAWINELQFIVQRYDGEAASIWLFSRDSGSPTKVADGVFISLIQN